ncbi:unnamed protein product [Rhodiola kirilowii]
MLGPGLSFGRIRGEDRFHVPNKARSRNCSQNRRKQDQRRPDARSDVTGGESFQRTGGFETRETESDEAVKYCVGVEKSKEVPLCNLERFMEAVTLSVPVQYLPKTTIRGLNSSDDESQPYFELCDLWESFEEWSAYGAGVPLLMNESDDVVQYYVPSLSAIQLYGDSRSCVSTSRQSEDSDLDAFRDTSSDSSSDGEPQRAKHNIKIQNHTLMKNDMESLSLMHKHYDLQQDSSSDEGESPDSQGQLLFEYFERSNPYTREPLADKISDLARWFPQIRSLRSCDLLSSSWISVAWYPIYRIPNGPTLKDLDACFLTFHSLLTPIIGASNPLCPITPAACPSEMHDCLPIIYLPTFGLSTYKFKGASWVPYGGSEHPLVRSLVQSAQSWLTLHNVSHPDYLHFCRR